GPRPISDAEAEQLAEVGRQNAEDYHAIDTLVELARIVDALPREQRRAIAQQLGMEQSTYNEVLFRAQYIARSQERGRSTLERETSSPDAYTLTGNSQARIHAYDQNALYRSIELRIEDKGQGPVVSAYPQLIDVRGFVMTSETPARVMELPYAEVASDEVLNDMLHEALENS